MKAIVRSDRNLNIVRRRSINGISSGVWKKDFPPEQFERWNRSPLRSKAVHRGGFEIKIRMCSAGSCMRRIRERSG